MALSSTVVTSAYPYLDITYTVGAFRSQAVAAYVDTGFDGYLIVPSSQVSHFGPAQFSASWELGDGSVVEALEYRGVIVVSGLAITIPARITVLGEEFLIGRGVVDRLRMTFDHGRRLLVEA